MSEYVFYCSEQCNGALEAQGPAISAHRLVRHAEPLNTSDTLLYFKVKKNGTPET